MKKFIVLIALVFVIFAAFTGCAKEVKNDTPTKIATLAGPSGMGLINLMDDSAMYEVTVYTTPDQVTPLIISGEVDIATVPSNLAAVLYAKTNKEVTILSSNTLGVLYIVENGDSVKTIADLRGKTLYVSGQGASPEYVIDDVLMKNGLTPGVDVQIEFVATHADLANMVVAGDAPIAMLPEPFVSTVIAKNSNVKSKISLNDEWQKIYGEGNGLPLTATIVRNSYLAENPDRVTQFMQDYSASVEYVNTNTTQAAQKIVDKGIVGAVPIAQAAIPRCGICFVSGQDCKSQFSEYFNVLFEGNPESVGGALPDDAIYYIP